MLSLERAYLVEKERQLDLVQQAQTARLLADLRHSSPPQPRNGLHQRALVYLGGLMITWGYQLRSRNEKLPAASFEEVLAGREVSPC